MIPHQMFGAFAYIFADRIMNHVELCEEHLMHTEIKTIADRNELEMSSVNSFRPGDGFMRQWT